jgi:hypothetical protein
MPKHMLQVNYTLDDLKGLESEGNSGRVAAATEATEGHPGSVPALRSAASGGPSW